MQVTKLTTLLVSSTLHQNEIARACNMPPSRIAEYRLGRKTIPTHHLIELCHFFRLPPDDILGVVEAPEVHAS